MFCIFWSKLSDHTDKLVLDEHTDTHMQTTTIPKGQNWPRARFRIEPREPVERKLWSRHDFIYRWTSSENLFSAAIHWIIWYKRMPSVASVFLQVSIIIQGMEVINKTSGVVDLLGFTVVFFGKHFHEFSFIIPVQVQVSHLWCWINTHRYSRLPLSRACWEPKFASAS